MTDERDLRKGFHGELDLIGQGITHLAASVIEAIPRATQVLLDGDLEGADYLICWPTRTSTPARSSWRSAATRSWRCRRRSPATCAA